MNTTDPLRLRLKDVIKNTSVLGPLVRKAHARLARARPEPAPPAAPFPGTEAYWEGRYATGGDSGAGSYGDFAAFKAEIINRFVRDNDVASVVEFGCGDGNQLKLAAYPRYLGFDISQTVIAQCRDTFRADPTKQFRRAQDYAGESAELALSLDVVYHLFEDAVFEDDMRRA
jgi:SAM-dependent methyltransferase